MVASTASINLQLNVTGEEQWAAIKTTLTELKTQIQSMNKGNAKGGMLAAMAEDMKKLRAEMKTLRDENVTLKAVLDKFNDVVGKGNVALQKSDEIAGRVTAHKREMARVAIQNFDAQTKQNKADKDAALSLALLESKYAKLTKTLNANPLFGKSRQASGFRAVAQEMKEAIDKAQQFGIAIDPAKLKRFQQAVDSAGAAFKRWGTDMGTLQGRLTFFEQQMDAILRASYRFKAVGADLQRVAQGIQRGFQNVMTVFGQFDFNIRRAVGALGAFEGYTGGVEKALSDLATGAMRAAREIKFIPIEEVAKGFYFWGSMTGAVVRNLEDVNNLVEEHSAVLKVASMTEVGFEQALKGVYSVLTQFYNGNLNYTVEVTEKLFYITQKTSAEFTDLINSFKMVGPVARGLGVSFDDVLTSIGQLADLGMRGTMAGRAIRQIFIQAARPSVIAKEKIQAAFSEFVKSGLDGMSDIVKKNLGDTYQLIAESGGSYYEAVFPKGEYAGIQNQIKVLAAMTMNMTSVARNALLGVMSTANSLPVLMALVGREVRTLQTDISQQSKLNLEDAGKYFKENWDLLSASWKGVTGALQRSWESLKVTVGTTVAKVLTPLFEKLTDIVDKITEWAQKNPAIVAALAKFAALVGVFTAIAGAVLTVTGSIMGLAAVSYVAFNSFFFPLTKAGKMLGEFGEKIPVVGRFIKGLQLSFLQVFGVIIALIESLVRNFDYVSERVGYFASSLGGLFGGIEGSIGLVAGALDSFNQGVGLVFDQVVRRTADIIAFFGNLIAMIDDLKRSIDNAFPALGEHLSNAINLGAKLIGILVGLVAVFRITKLLTGFSLLNISLKGAVTQLGLVRSGAITAGAALKGMVASSGIGLLVVGLSLLVEWLGSTNQSLEDLKAATSASAAAFGDWAEDAESAARRVATAAVSVRDFTFGQVQPQFYSGEGMMGTGGNVFGQGEGVAETAAANAAKALEIDYATYQRSIETKATEIIDRWKGMVSDLNAKFSSVGSDYQLSFEHFMDTYTQVDKLGLKGLTQDKIEELVLALSQVNPGATREEFDRAWRVIAMSLGREWGQSIGISIDQAYEIATNEAAQHIAEQGKNDKILTDLINSLGLSPESNMSDWLALIEREVTLSDGQKMLIKDALAGDMFSEDGLKQIWDGVMQGAGQAAERLAASNEIPQTVIGQMAEALKQGFIQLQYSAIEQAMPGMNSVITRIAEQSELGDLGAIMATITGATVADGFGTLADMLRAGTIPDDVEKGILDYVKLAAERNMPGAQALLDSLKEGSEGLDGSFGEAARKWMEDIKDSFLSAVDAGINKSIKDVISGLRKRLNNPARYSDAASISKLLKLLGNETLLYAMAQTSDSLARQQAFEAYNNSVVQPTLGGIELAIENGDTDRAQEDLKKFINKMAIVPDYYWQSLDPEAAKSMLDFLRRNYAGDLPPELVADITSSINRGLDTAIANVEPQKLTPQQLYFVNKAELAEGGQPAATTLVKTVVPDGTATAIQTAITSAVQTAVGAVLPGIPGISAPVGTAIINGIMTGISAGVRPLTTLLTTVVNMFDNGAGAAYNGGVPVGSSWVRGVASGISTNTWRITTKVKNINAMLSGGSPPPAGPLKNVDTGGYNAGKSWSDNFSKGVGEAKKKVDRHLRDLQRRLSSAKSTLRRLIGLNNPNDYGYYEKEIKRQQGVVERAQRALDKYLRGDGKGGKGGRTGGETGRDGDPVISLRNAQRHVQAWKAQIVQWRKQIVDLLAGGLTEEERNRKTYLDQLIGDNRWKIDHAMRVLRDKHGREKTPKHPDKGGPSVGDTLNDATVTEVSKRIIEIHVDVESKDGSVNRAQLAAIRRGVGDALTLADMEHLVTVG